MPWLVLLFIALPVAEIWLLIEVGGRIGGWWTVLAVVAISALGAAFARWRGIAMARAIRVEVDAGHAPGRMIMEGALIAFAGVLFIIPGFITDVLALLCLVPWTRRLVLRLARVQFERAAARGTAGLFMSFSGGFARGAAEASEIKDVAEQDVKVRSTKRPALPDREP